MATEDSIDPASLHVLEIAGNAIVGGMERHVQLVVEGLRGQGIKVTALCPYESSFTEALRSLGCPVHIAMLGDSLAWRSLLTAAEIIRRQQVSLVHTHLFNSTFLGGVAAGLAGVPAATTVHGMYVSSEEMALARLTGSHLITVCTAAYSMGLALGVPEDQISMIPNSVDTQRFRPELDGQAFRESLGVPPGAPLVGMVARLSREKGPDLFLQAAALLAATRPEIHYALVGDGPMTGELEREIRTLGLDDRVHLAGLRPDTTTVFPGLDVACQSSRTEGLPLSLLEAMAAARPVEATTAGGIPEVIEAGRSGWLVAPGDVGAIAERILWLLDNPEQARRMGQEARRRVSEHFDVRRQMAAITSLFQRLVDSRRPQTRAALRLGRVYNRARVS
jgi:glycosyltransferase involved in cell wall biosynthesis